MAGMGARNALAMVKAKRVIMRRNMVKKLSGYLDCNQMVVAIPSTKKEGIFSDRIDCLDRVGESFCQMESTVASCSRHEAKKQERTITDVLNLTTKIKH